MQVLILTATINELCQTIREPEKNKNKNSRNSSKSPSSDGCNKKPASLRGKSEKKQGGQEGIKDNIIQLDAESLKRYAEIENNKQAE